MEMILIRHGEPDYSPCEKRGFIGQGHDLAPQHLRAPLKYFEFKPCYRKPHVG